MEIKTYLDNHKTLQSAAYSNNMHYTCGMAFTHDKSIWIITSPVVGKDQLSYNLYLGGRCVFSTVSVESVFREFKRVWKIAQNAKT